MKYIDLHVHSSCSDGTVSPADLVALAVRQGLTAFALTDHDTVQGVADAQAAARKLRSRGQEIYVIPGVEVSAAFNGSDIHILGLNVNPKNPALLQKLKGATDERDFRNRKMAANLAAAGLDITYEEVQEIKPDAVITRAHFAACLVKKGYAANNNDAFQKYLNTKSPYYVARKYFPPEEVISLILAADGVPVLAHPLLYHLEESELKKLVCRLKDAGLMGLEAIYTCNSHQDETFVRQLARQNGLLISGGSDFHGTNKPDISMGTGRGNLKIPYSVLEELHISPAEKALYS